jgi:hypothetical protein
MQKIKMQTPVNATTTTSKLPTPPNAEMQYSILL